MKKHKLVALILILMVTMTVFAGCGSAPKQQETKKMTVAMLKLTSSAPLFIGIEKGFFKEEGIEIDPQWFEAAHPIAVATASNKVDVGATGITASLFNMVASGQALTIVADKGREQKGYSSSAILVTTELYGKGVTKISDLKGKRIGITQTGSTYHYMIGRLLESQGLTLKDVELVPLTKLSALMAALQSKQVDGVILNEPNISRVVSDGYGKVIAQVGDVMDYQTSGLFFSPNLIKDKDLALRFMKGYIKSSRYYYDAVLAKPAGKNYDEVIKIIAKYTGAPESDIKTGLPYMDRDGKLLASDIDTQINWYKTQGMIEKPITGKQVTDSTLLEQALKQLVK